MSQTDPDVEAVLTERLASLGQFSGAIGGTVGGGAGGTDSAGRGGGRGAAWTAQRLKTETAAGGCRFDSERAEAVLVTLSRVLQCPLNHGDSEIHRGAVTLRGVVGSGFARANPTYVLAVVDLADGTVSIAAHAKEGLIKQHSAQKAVDRIVAELSP